jgi:drug/metabolite transporter (DMT)-like permease
MPGENHKNTLKAIGAIIIAFLFLALVSVLMKIEIKSDATIEWAIFIQSATGFLIMSVIAARNNFRDLKTSKLKYHIVRGVGGIFAFACTAIAISKIPLVDASLLNNTAPLFIPIITLIWLKNKIEKKIWWGILVGFIGIIFILDPKEDDLLKSGDLYGIAAGISLAIAYVALGVLTKTESFVSILFYYAFISFVLSFPFAILNWCNPPVLIWIYAVAAGILFIAYSFLLQYAYRYVAAVKLSPLNFSVVVFTGFFDWLIFGHVPGISSLIGIVLVTAGGILAITLHEKDNKELKHHWH